MSGISEENRQPDSKDLEQRARKIISDFYGWTDLELRTGAPTIVRDLVPAISAALLSVQRETREADAKIADDYGRRNRDVTEEEEAAKNIAAAIRSQGGVSAN